MDTGKGKFELLQLQESDKFNQLAIKTRIKEMEDKYPNHGGWFTVGQVIEINGSRFRVKTVKPDELRLKLLSK